MMSSPHSTTTSWFARLRQKVVMRVHQAKIGWKLTILFISLLLYMTICALVFSALEANKDRESYEYYQTVKASYMKRYNMSQSQWIRFVEDASVISKRGFVGEYKNYWNFYHSFWFTTTIVTTMGFGQIVPRTFGGRLFCIFSALFGIPLNMLVLKYVGEKINNGIHSYLKYVEQRFRKRDRHESIKLKTACVSFLLMTLVLLIGGALDTIFDGWTFFDGVYFNFIAMSTIGFGDLFPRVEHSQKLDRLGFTENGKRIFASSIMLVYMVIGLSVVSTVIYAIVKAIEEVSEVNVPWHSSIVGTELAIDSEPPQLKSIQGDCSVNSQPSIVVPASDSEQSPSECQTKQSEDYELDIVVIKNPNTCD